MKKSVFVRFVSVLVLFVILATYMSAFSAGAVEAIGNMIIDQTVFSLCDEAVLLPYDTFIKTKPNIDEGLTVIYGKNLDITSIRSITSPNKKEQLLSATVTNGSAATISSADTVDVNTENKITYLYMCLKDGDYMSFYNQTILCDVNINEETVNGIIESLLYEEKVEQAKEEFVRNQITVKPELAGYFVNSTRATSYESPAVLIEYATIRSIRNYTPSYPSQSPSYPVVMYKSTSTFTAYLEDYVLDDRQIYTLEIDTSVIHGSDPASYQGVANVYNDLYGNAVILCGGRAAFINEFAYTNGDQYTAISPSRNYDDISTTIVPVTIEGHRSFIDLNITNCLDDIALTCSLNPLDTSTVQILAGPGFQGYHSITTAPYRFVAMARLDSAGMVLSTTCETSVFIAFQNNTTMIRSLYQQEMYYDDMFVE